MQPLNGNGGTAGLEQFCEFLKLASNPNRMRILMFLRQGESAVSDIESSLGLKQPNLSHELRKLRDHGLVETRRQSKVVFYSLAGPRTTGLLDGIRQLQESLAAADDTPVSIDTEHKDQRPDDRGECGHFSVVHRSRPTSNQDPLT